jgi:hypothetical protein
MTKTISYGTRYTLVGGLNNTQIPISSFSLRKRHKSPSFLSVVIPTIDFADVVAEIYENELELKLYAQQIEDAYGYATEFLLFSARLDTYNGRVDVHEGANNKSTIVTCYKSTIYHDPAVFDLSDYALIYKSPLKYRLSRPFFALNPLDNVTIKADSITVGLINYTVSPTHQTIEIEAA